MAPLRDHRLQQRGFSLVEMSIVLVVIGLIVGGVIASQSLIRNAALQKVLSERETYTAAMRIFKERYSYYPGDFPNASKVWGAIVASCDATNATAATPSSTITCDGNGDGIIGGLDPRAANGNPINEMFRAWQHLYNAKLVKEFYTGAYQTSADITAAAAGIVKHASSAARFSVNAPQSKFKDTAGWNVSTLSGVLDNTCDLAYSTGTAYGNALVFASHVSGKNFNIGMTYDTFQLLTPEEAKNMDIKIDDGMPLTGDVRGVGAGDLTVVGNTFCYSSTCGATTDYALTNSSGSCGLAFLNNF